ncbi:MAG: hypothetical protein ACYSU8_07880 [Planctomycetota bacterium]
MKNSLVILITLSLCLISVSAFSNEDKELSRPGYKSPMTEKDKQIIKESQQKSPEEIERSRNKFKEAIKESDRDIVFRGKVIDFDGNPVQDAVVVVSVRSFDPTVEIFFSSKKHKLKTDSKGLFLFEGKGSSLSIRDIIKEGYEFKREYLDYTSFQYDISIKKKSGLTVPFDPNSDETYMFKIRHRCTVNYLLTDSFRWSFRKSENSPFAPLLIGKWNGPYGKEMNLKARRSEKSKPLEISCLFNEDYSEFELSFNCTVEESGIYLSDTLLYEAPAEGYQRQIIYRNVMVESGKNEQKKGWYRKKLYLYVKGPNGKYYSRIDLWVSTHPPTQHNEDACVQIGGDIYTNPEGRRYLDYDSSYNDDEGIFRNKLVNERHKAKIEARKNKKPFDEKAFKEKVDKERKMKKEKGE